jgi:hypothetical protein
MLTALALGAAGMTPKHLVKLAGTILVLFVGFHFGIDIGAKIDTSIGSTSTPAS